MVIPFVVPEISGRGGTTPPDAIKLSEKADAINGRRIYGGVYTLPFTIFFDFRLHSLRYEKDFLPVLSKLSQASMVKIFHFSDEWKVVSVAPQRGGVHPPINLEVFFTHILATATRLNTSYGLEILHAQLSRHVGITQKVLRHIRHF